MNIIRTLFLILVFLYFGVGIPNYAEAQLIPAQTLGNPSALNLLVSPTHPAPHSEVTVTAQSFAFDLNRSDIYWQLDGKTLNTSVGQKEITFKLGESGETRAVKISVITQEGVRYLEQLSITPASVDLIVEANTYTPPFYSGRALPSIGAPIRIVAIPNIRDVRGNIISSSNLIFTWSTGNISGRGRDVMYPEVADLPSASRIIEVGVQTLDGSVIAVGETELPQVNPSLLVYEDHPTLGVLYEHAAKDAYDLTQEEVSFVTEPYYFPTQDRTDSNLVYHWVLNNTPVQNTSVPGGQITLRPTSREGRASVDLTATYGDLLFQRASTNVMINLSPVLDSIFE